MSKLVRYLESLGKSNAKKWSQIWKFLLIMCLKLPWRKKVFYGFFHLFTLFKRLFAPTSQSQMSKPFWFSEFIGKSSGKKWSRIWKLLLIKGVKSTHKKNLFFSEFCLSSIFFLVSVLLPALVKRFSVSCMRDFLLYKKKNYDGSLRCFIMDTSFLSLTVCMWCSPPYLLRQCWMEWGLLSDLNSS